jgi:hypothetical protein
MFARPSELAAYRSFRTADHEGLRLARAQAYLEQFPSGAWANEVRAVFEVEEPQWFEAAQTSRARARAYLVDLPQGPHADAARALLLLFDEHQEDLDTVQLLSDARRTAAMLDAESTRRRRLGDLVLEELAALLDPSTWGAHPDAPPPSLGRVLRGSVRRTWGAAPRAWRSDELFFVVPTPEGAQARVADVRFHLTLERDRVASGVIGGHELFFRWAEAMDMRTYDPTSAADRVRVASIIADVLGGALEGTLPTGRCGAKAKGEQTIVARACDGWVMTANMAGGKASAAPRREVPPLGLGDGEDTIEVRGPSQLDRAPAPGMR